MDQLLSLQGTTKDALFPAIGGGNPQISIMADGQSLRPSQPFQQNRDLSLARDPIHRVPNRHGRTGYVQIVVAIEGEVESRYAGRNGRKLLMGSSRTNPNDLARAVAHVESFFGIESNSTRDAEIFRDHFQFLKVGVAQNRAVGAARYV